MELYCYHNRLNHNKNKSHYFPFKNIFRIGRLHVYIWKDCEFVADLKNWLTFPNANKTESKYSITPKSTKKIPNPVRPMPISEKQKQM